MVKDFDQFGVDETLGIVQVQPSTLYKANGERMEFKLQPVPGKTGDEVPGYLAIRCRRATAYDKNFMEGLESSMTAIAAPKAPKANINLIKSLRQGNTKVEDGIKKVSRDDVLRSWFCHVCIISHLISISSKFARGQIRNDQRRRNGCRRTKSRQKS